MIALKVLFLIATFLVIGESVPVLRDDHNIMLCPDPTKATKLLHQETFQKNGQLFTVLKEHVAFPSSGINTDLINCIIVRDLANDGTGGLPEVSGGGINFYYVEIELVSQRGHGLKFEIEIYGEIPVTTTTTIGPKKFKK